MRLPEDDEQYLNQKGYRWELLPDQTTNPVGGLLVIRDHPLDPVLYVQEKCDLMIRVPPGYNMAALDMFYASPAVTLKAGGYPNCANQFETHGGTSWQRFSRHLSIWRPGVDTIRTMLSFADRELKGTK